MTDPAWIPHLPRLADDYIHSYLKVREFYDGDFRDPAAFKRQTERVRARSMAREELAAVLAEQNKDYGCGLETLGAVAKIVRDRACAVVTGQQVGLFSGPLYTVYKALTAVKLSEELGRRGLGSVVPVFWLASDDHDLAEIDHIGLVDKNNRFQIVRCPAPSPGSKVPVSNVPLPPEIGDCLRELDELTLNTEFKAETIAALGEAYAPGRSFVEAFARWMTRLFKSRGLVLVDAGDPRLKEMARAVFCHEIEAESPSTREAAAASERLRRAGYEAQIPLHEGILNLFYTESERQAVQWADGAFHVKGLPSPLAKDDLLALAGKKPFLFSPNVLLRPVYQDTLLPTVAYVGGPAEIAYFAQMKGVYEAFGLPMPVIYPRKSLTIVERAVGHILKKYGLGVPDIWREADGVVREVAGDEVPAAVRQALSRVREDLDHDFAVLKAEVLAFESGLSDSLNLAKGKLTQQLDFVERKLRQAATKRNEVVARQLRKAVDNLFPNRHLQERVFNIAPYLIKYGMAFVDSLDQAIDMNEADHQFLFL
jgi:bacillithiol biosynthesis cysteine-adding enzyme BshC